MTKEMRTCFVHIFVLVVIDLTGRTGGHRFGDVELVYNWTNLELDWPSEADKQAAIANGSYVPERNLLAGIKIYKGDVYVTVPRWTWTSGHPLTLAKVVHTPSGVKLRPYPSWASQRQGDCQALQYAQSMEVDPNTGLMYVLDSGRVGGRLNLCSAKIFVFDLNTDKQVDSYQVPTNVASSTGNAMNDIVLDYVDGKVRYAYISDVSEGRIHVYDFQTRTAHNLEDASMKAESRTNGTTIRINGRDYTFGGGVDGIAMAPDFRYVYYCPLGGYNLYQVPTSTLRNPQLSGASGIRWVGRKISQSDGMAHGSKHLFYGVLSLNAVFYWDADKDMADQQKDIGQVILTTQVQVARDDEMMTWPDTFAFDEQGWLWLVANSLNTFRDPGGNPRNRIWKIFVNETSYLYEANRRTIGTVVG